MFTEITKSKFSNSKNLSGNPVKVLFSFLNTPVSIAPLVVFRIAFGTLMFLSTIRFIVKGWVYELYIKPVYYFSYYGFEWVKPLGNPGMYFLFAVIALSALGIALGFFYRISAILFFLSFTYVELIDKTNYLNHYYFVSLIAFLLVFVPANKYFSSDVFLGRIKKEDVIPAWTVFIIKLQLAIVYFFAGVAKLNYDWLIEAQPLKTWLPAKSYFFLVGPLLTYEWIAYLFSWFGMLFDLTIPFWLSWKKSRPFAYFFVLVFHIATWLLFPIGMFPFIMICSTIIFFDPAFHKKVITTLQSILNLKFKILNWITRTSLKSQTPIANRQLPTANSKTSLLTSQFTKFILIIFFAIQLFLPFRYLFYPGKLFWTEEGFRFSWRVMLIEKMGMAVFTVKDRQSDKAEVVYNKKYLTPLQEKMMATQPDMILQFAHFIAEEYKKNGFAEPEVFVESYVALNGKSNRPFIDPFVNLAAQKESFEHKQWVLPFEQRETGEEQ